MENIHNRAIFGFLVNLLILTLICKYSKDIKMAIVFISLFFVFRIGMLFDIITLENNKIIKINSVVLFYNLASGLFVLCMYLGVYYLAALVIMVIVVDYMMRNR